MDLEQLPIKTHLSMFMQLFLIKTLFPVPFSFDYLTDLIEGKKDTPETETQLVGRDADVQDSGSERTVEEEPKQDQQRRPESDSESVEHSSLTSASALKEKERVPTPPPPEKVKPKPKDKPKEKVKEKAKEKSREKSKERSKDKPKAKEEPKQDTRKGAKVKHTSKPLPTPKASARKSSPGTCTLSTPQRKLRVALKETVLASGRVERRLVKVPDTPEAAGESAKSRRARSETPSPSKVEPPAKRRRKDKEDEVEWPREGKREAQIKIERRCPFCPFSMYTPASLKVHMVKQHRALVDELTPAVVWRMVENLSCAGTRTISEKRLRETILNLAHCEPDDADFAADICRIVLRQVLVRVGDEKLPIQQRHNYWQDVWEEQSTDDVARRRPSTGRTREVETPSKGEDSDSDVVEIDPNDS
ncbi:Beta-N-acetylhexosaminidase [Frankliniella fusca]|uniref:Beta-N-acetylhexosaminidase n=1 Tax=Frankliniella fusca TaxID=407009 RepID=A0AAE1LNY0_9NEOP|nr:Beta-N-acetylhexosaminidase [Frankliniella fusca]